MASADGNITRKLVAWSQGDAQALDELMSVVYGELRALAAHYLRQEPGPQTLQPTALVHEAWLRLVRAAPVEWQGRKHFFGFAARLMRQILVDEARRRRSEKRAPLQTRLPLDDARRISAPEELDLLALDDALDALAVLNERQSRIVELRFFGGLTAEEIAAVLNVSAVTVKREWRAARAWLFRAINGEKGGRRDARKMGRGASAL
jgi:RNA polymerase sigma-70 factor, ECF subfamily